MPSCLGQERFRDAIRLELSRLHGLALPPTGAFAEKFELDSWSRPARRIGGDVLAAWALEPGRVGIFLGDVMGHGTPAAVVASAVRAGLHQVRQVGAVRPAALLAGLNDIVCDLFPEYFVTATVCVADAVSGTLTCSQAGHPAVIVRSGREVQHISQRSLPLGLTTTVEYEESHVRLPEGATVLLYSDGVLEGLAAPGRSGHEALQTIVESGDSEDVANLVRRIRRALRKSRKPIQDDCSVLAVRQRG